jgi:polyribonucleotide nucleotidyltransferase
VKDAMKLAQAAVRDIIDAQVELLKSDIAEKTAVEDVQQFLTSVVADTTSSQQLLADSEANIARSAIEATSSVNSDAVLSKAAEEKFKGFSVPRGLTEAAETVGLQDAIQLFRDTAAGKLRKADRGMAEGALATKIKNALSEDAQWGKEHIVVRAMVVDAVMAKALRTVALAGQRVDGRSTSELRQITCNVDVLPSVHGSAFFQRGDTHVLCTTTLGKDFD